MLCSVCVVLCSVCGVLCACAYMPVSLSGSYIAVSSVYFYFYFFASSFASGSSLPGGKKAVISCHSLLYTVLLHFSVSLIC